MYLMCHPYYNKQTRVTNTNGSAVYMDNKLLQMFDAAWFEDKDLAIADDEDDRSSVDISALKVADSDKEDVPPAP